MSQAEDRTPPRQVFIDPRDLPGELSLLAARHHDPDVHPYIVERLYPVGAVLIYGRPGGGKTTLAFQVELWLSGGAPFGKPPEEIRRTLIIDYEGTGALAIGQSKRLAPFGTLPTDHTLSTDDIAAPDGPIWLSTRFPGATFSERFAELEKRLVEARNAGHPFALVRIDTMRAFLGPAPQGMNAYEWDSACLIRINQLANEMDASIILIHHPNKAGEVSGSTGIAGSVTAVYRLDHPPGEPTGTLKCEKNRVGPEQEWPLEWDLARGMWVFSGRLTAAQAAHTGVKRQIIDYLTKHGPTGGPDLRAALVRDGVKDKTARDMLTRLKDGGYVIRRADDLWTLADGPAPVLPEAVTSGWGPGTIGEEAQRCEVCREVMTVIEPGQLAHPMCDPEGKLVRHPARSAPAPEADPEPIAAAVGEGQGEGEVCADCEMPITGADPHEGCVPGVEDAPKWPGAFDLMRETLNRSRMSPVGWIPPAGHPKAAKVRQTRDMPQWQAAIAADLSAEAGFLWTRPGLLEEFGPDRLVVPFDRTMSYPSACSSVPLAANVLTESGRLDRHPRELGNPDPSRPGKTLGLAGVAEIVVPAWDHPAIAHPLGKRAVPGQRMTIPTSMLEDLWKLHEQGLIPRPEVTASFTGRRTVGLLDPFAKGVREARAEYASDPVMTAAVKRSSSIVLRMLYCTVPSSWWRPDWRAAVVSQGAYRHWLKAWQATQAGEIAAGLSNTDAVSFVLPEGADPDMWVPAGYELGRTPGTIHPGVIRVRADQCDLSGIDPGRITPSGHPKFVEVAGPVPLHVWLMRRG